MFYGDGREGENPQNFLQQFRREMRGLSTTDDKAIAKAFVNYLGAGSTADIWYDGLQIITQTSWTALEQAFITHWPRITQAKRSEQEIKRELLTTVIDEKELGEKVKNGGVEVWTHVAWADKMATLTSEANLTTKTTHIWQVHDKLPKAVKEVVKSTHTDWAAFLQAIRDIDLQHICDAVDKRKKRESERRAIENRIRILEAAQQSPTAGIRAQMTRTSITNQQTTSLAPTAPVRPNDAVFGQGGRRGNLAFALRARQPPPRQSSTPQQVAALRARLNTLLHHPDTEAGRMAYRTQIAEWDAQHGRETRITEETLYPL
jgi:hypothetical protein